jgi:hypothetical protein
MNLKKDKRGVAIIGMIAFIFISLIAIYIILWLPFPAFASIRSMINYAMVVIFWITLQVALVYGYYKLGILVMRGLSIYRGKMHLWMVNVKNFMLTR